MDFLDPLGFLLFVVGCSIVIACLLFAFYELKSMIFLYGTYVFIKHAVKFYLK